MGFDSGRSHGLNVCLVRGHTGSTRRNWEMNGVWTIPKAASTQLPGDEQMGGTSEFSLCHP